MTNIGRQSEMGDAGDKSWDPAGQGCATGGWPETATVSFTVAAFADLFIVHSSLLGALPV